MRKITPPPLETTLFKKDPSRILLEKIPRPRKNLDLNKQKDRQAFIKSRARLLTGEERMATRTVSRRMVVVSRPRRRGKKFTLPIAAIAGFAPLASDVYYQFKAGGAAAAIQWLKYDLVGIDGNGHFNFAGIARGWGPILTGFIAHGIASKLGINRQLARMGIPVIRI